MLNVIHYSRNANQTYNEVLLHINQKGHHKKKNTNNKFWRGCGKMGILLHFGWNVNWHSHHGE